MIFPTRAGVSAKRYGSRLRSFVNEARVMRGQIRMLSRTTSRDIIRAKMQNNRSHENSFDTAQICLNGHVINRRFESWPDKNAPHCAKCGAKTITQCPDCKTNIRGGYFGAMPSPREESADPFCSECGAAYPWTESRLSTARELVREFERLSESEKGVLIRSLDDLVRDTPKTPVAILRFKEMVAKAGSVGADALKTILVQIVVESAKHQIWH